MSLEHSVVPRAPRLRCYQCGSPEINAICHHCHRPMCRAHTAYNPATSLFEENREFLKLDLESRPTYSANGAHCADHVRGENHPIPAYRRIMVYPGLLILLVALFYLFGGLRDGWACLQNPPQPYAPGIGAAAEVLRDPATRSSLPAPACYQPELLAVLPGLLAWSLLLGLSLVTVGYGILLDQDKYQAELHGRIPIPLTPRSRGLLAHETLTGRIELTPDGRYQEEIVQRQGVFDPRLEFTVLDKQRLERYAQKYQIPVTNEAFTAGYLHLLGAPAIRWQGEVEPLARLLPLQGRVDGHPYLLNERGRGRSGWERRWSYDLIPTPTGQDSDTAARLPVRLTLNRQQEGNGQRIGLIIQLPDLLQHTQTVTRLMLPKLTLFAPNLPEPKATYPPATVLPVEEEGRSGYKIVWQNVTFPVGDDNRFQPQQQVVIEFPDLGDDPVTVSGELSLLLEPAPAGLSQAHFYSPLGYRYQLPVAVESEAPIPVLATDSKERPGCLPRLAVWFQRQFRQASSVVKENLASPDGVEADSEEETASGSAEKPSLYDLFQNPALSRSTLKLEQPDSQAGSDYDLADAWPIQSQLNLQVTFSLALTDLVYHERYSRRTVKPLPGVRPTYETVQRLVEAITLPHGTPDQNFHIRAVIENPPQPSQRQSQLAKHLWDINGRYYHRIFPLDFHLIISGTAVQPADPADGRGPTADGVDDAVAVEILVQAHVSHPELKAKVDEISTELEKRITAALTPGKEKRS